MADPFLAEIRLFSINFAPKGWAMCNGQLLPINQNQPLFSLLGTTYGGNGQTTFALPDLRGLMPIHFGAGHTLGERGGEEAHTLNQNELPAHNHFVNAAATPATSNATVPNAVLGSSTPANLYGPASNLQAMQAATIANTGGSQAHENRMPFLVVNFCIALIGIFPSPN